MLWRYRRAEQHKSENSELYGRTLRDMRRKRKMMAAGSAAQKIHVVSLASENEQEKDDAPVVAFHRAVGEFQVNESYVKYALHIMSTLMPLS
ncbi:hypothetical protein OSTOST_04250 [Ostertagia ostertagi]